MYMSLLNSLEVQGHFKHYNQLCTSLWYRGFQYLYGWLDQLELVVHSMNLSIEPYIVIIYTGNEPLLGPSKWVLVALVDHLHGGVRWENQQ